MKEDLGFYGNVIFPTSSQCSCDTNMIQELNYANVGRSTCQGSRNNLTRIFEDSIQYRMCQSSAKIIMLLLAAADCKADSRTLAKQPHPYPDQPKVLHSVSLESRQSKRY